MQARMLTESERPDTPENVLTVADLGVTPYDDGLQAQEALRDRRIRGESSDVLLLLEHPPVYTIGRRGTLDDLGLAATGDVPVRRVARGGQATFHGPGQLVGYPIVDLSRRGMDVQAYVQALERALIRAVGQFGLEAGRVPGRVGVWVGPRKLASVGVGIRHWVTMHGFALNVSTDLTYFDRIVACGLPGVRMTSLAREGCRRPRGEVVRCVAASVADELGYGGKDMRWIGHA